MLKRREEYDTYLTHICRHRLSIENPVKRKEQSQDVQNINMERKAKDRTEWALRRSRHSESHSSK